MRSPVPGRIAGFAAAGSAAGISYVLGRLVRSRPGGERWQRSNHAGDPVTLLEGPIATAGALTGVAVRYVVRSVVSDEKEPRRMVAEIVAITGAATVGAYDDLFGSTSAKGFRGHLRSLRQGVITSGMIKIAGIGVAGLVAAVIDRPARSGARGIADVLINTGLIAGTANLINLFDLRPGRAAKVIIALGGLTPGAAPVTGAAIGVLPADLAGTSMLGDCGANALGAGLGLAAGRLPRPLRLLALGGVVGLTLASEKISFTRVIQDNPVLRGIDEFGRPKPDLSERSGAIAPTDSDKSEGDRGR